MRQLFKLPQRKKVLVCSNCNTKFRFPVIPGKKLNVTCPNCNATYQISFVNPLVELVKGRLKWASLSQSEKQKIIMIVGIILASFWLIISSLSPAVSPVDQPVSNEFLNAI